MITEELQTEELEVPQAFSGLGASPGFAALGRRIHQLGRDLPWLEQRRLVHWIENPTFAGFQDSNPAWHWLVNEAMTALSHQNIPLPEWSDTLIRLADDVRRDVVIRDYALQHMVDLLQPITQGDNYESCLPKRKAMINCLDRAAREQSQSYSGTALLGLHHSLRLAELRENPGDGEPIQPWRPDLPFNSKNLHSIALAILGASNACEHARISSLQVCAQRGFSDALPFARNWGADRLLPDTLRISSIAAIGLLGSAEDSDLLNRIRAERKARLALAIQSAGKSIQRRLAPIRTNIPY